MTSSEVAKIVDEGGTALPGNPADEAERTIAPRPARRGPRAARGQMRETILKAARAEFIDAGYDGATMRAIAARAGCDSAMATYYFGSKQKLFRACMNLPADPTQEVLAILVPGPDGAAERLLDYALDLYGERMTRETMQALMKSLISDAQTSQRFRTYIRTDVLDRIASFIGADESFAEQIEVVLATMYGIGTMRYIVGLEPIASLSRERLKELFAPMIQEHIDQFFKK